MVPGCQSGASPCAAPMSLRLRDDTAGVAEDPAVRRGVDDRRVPPDDYAAPDADREVADQRGLVEVAMVPDLDPRLRAGVEHHSVHRAARADDQPRVEPAAEQAKGAVARQAVAGDDAVRPEAHVRRERGVVHGQPAFASSSGSMWPRSEEHTSELQSRRDLVCRLLLEKKKRKLLMSSSWITHNSTYL